MKVIIFVWKYVNDAGDSALMRAAEYNHVAGDVEFAADMAFHIFNAPEEILEDWQLEILGDYHKRFPSLSTGDYVQVDDTKFICKSIGWGAVDEIPEGKMRTAAERRNLILD